MALEEPPINRLIALTVVLFVALAAATFLLPRYDEHKGRQHWSAQDRYDPNPELLSDRRFCAAKLHRDTTGLEPWLFDELRFALKPEERLRPCMEARGWLWRP